MPHILEAGDLNAEMLDEVFVEADHYSEILAQPAGSDDRRGVAETLSGSVVTLMFLSDSTRTMKSFKSAALRLGAGVDEVQGRFVAGDDGVDRLHITGSSTGKGESYEDTLRMYGAYSDALVLRSPKEGAAHEAARICGGIAIANGGDGSGHHPTQAALDLYTIRQRFGRLDNLKIMLGNDLRYSRVAHSLIELLTQYEGNEFILASTKGLSIPDEVRHHLLETETKFTEVENPYPHLSTVDIAYWMRSQRERWPQPALACNTIQLDRGKMKELGPHAVAMHALPMTPDEVGQFVPGHPQFIAYEQAANGVPVRMALLRYMLSAQVRVEPVHAFTELQVA